MDAALVAAITAHMMDESPRECCGLIVREAVESYVRCRNIALHPDRDFILDPLDYAAAVQRGEVVAVVHSHPRSSAQPSHADLAACEITQLPWHIISGSGDIVSFYPTGWRAPLLGREFKHGVLDCYSLVRDYYFERLKIELPDFDREEEWWNKPDGPDLYLENFRRAGFHPVDISEMREHDGILIQVRSEKVNHAAVYLGNNMMMHHVMNRVSTEEVYGGLYQKYTRMIVRHKSLA